MMMTLPPSDSSPTSTGFAQLHEQVQRWIWQQGWTELRAIQEQAIAPILSADTDVIISAATAGGKTEAAFLPIFSHLLRQEEGKLSAISHQPAANLIQNSPGPQPSALSPQPLNSIQNSEFKIQNSPSHPPSPLPHPSTGIQVLYISPLKALINDQYRRLSALGELLDIPIHPWHGDIDAGRKQKVLKQPSGVVLITPESLEALFVRRGYELAAPLRALSYIVVDELHSFIGVERGKQLQSLMHRVELVLQRSIPRLGLSATLGDLSLAADFLRPGKGEAVVLINPLDDDGQELKIQVRGYRKVPPVVPLPPDGREESGDERDIAAHLFKVLRGTNNLIFINSRADVEAYADRLRRLCEQQRVPNEFLPHHGNLSKELREEAEQALKGERPANVVCTTTLEMGIDIGAMTSIAQVGAPFSVTSTRQRLGRSGRREGDPAILRCYISEPEVTPDTSPQDALHPELVQTIALINLLLERWCEPPVVGKLHLSTLIQQLLSLIAQVGGIKAVQAWQILCQTGPFANVAKPLFIQLLRCLGTQDLIQQSQDGLLLPGLKGERLINHYSFYTAFQTPEAYRVVTSGKTLGTLPVEYPLVEGTYLIFAGYRWQILSVDLEHKVVEVAKAAAGRAPIFSGSGGWIHDRIRQEMYRLYCSADIPIFLDATARNLLIEARATFTRYDLTQVPVLAYGNQTLLFCWAGDVVMNTILVQLQTFGLTVNRDAIALVVEGLTPQQLLKQLQTMAQNPPADAVTLAASVKNKLIEKHDRFLSQELLCQNYASAYLNIQGAQETIQKVAELSFAESELGGR
jgi:ATP-dependent Lhr-like helicase